MKVESDFQTLQRFFFFLYKEILFLAPFVNVSNFCKILRDKNKANHNLEVLVFFLRDFFLE